MITPIKLSKYDRMLRIGFGKNKGKWFFRIDFWFIGFRISKRL